MNNTKAETLGCDAAVIIVFGGWKELGNTETRFGSLGIFLTLFCIGGALIDTAIVNAVSYFSFEFIACFLLGLFMVVVSFLSFFGLVLPAWRDKSYTLKNELFFLVLMK